MASKNQKYCIFNFGQFMGGDCSYKNIPILRLSFAFIYAFVWHGAAVIIPFDIFFA